MSVYDPDLWALVKIIEPTGFQLYKILGSWGGGYLTGPSWKISSGITQVKKTETGYAADNYSGSVYYLHKTAYGSTSYAAGVLANLKEKSDSVYGPGRVTELTEEEAFEVLETLSASDAKDIKYF